jgi:acyl-coenzyme A thioesterase PaaI-like protein
MTLRYNAETDGALSGVLRELLDQLANDTTIDSLTGGRYRSALAKDNGEWGVDWQNMSGPHADDGNAVYIPFTVTAGVSNDSDVMDAGKMSPVLETMTSLVAVALTGEAQSSTANFRVSHMRQLSTGTHAVMKIVLVRYSRTMQLLEVDVYAEDDRAHVALQAAHTKTVRHVKKFHEFGPSSPHQLAEQSSVASMAAWELTRLTNSRQGHSNRFRAYLTRPPPSGQRCATQTSLQSVLQCSMQAVEDLRRWGTAPDDVTVRPEYHGACVQMTFVVDGALLNPRGVLDFGVALQALTLITSAHAAATTDAISVAAVTPATVSALFLRPVPAGERVLLRSYLRQPSPPLLFLDADVVDADDESIVHITAMNLVKCKEHSNL